MKIHGSIALVCSFIFSTVLVAQVPEPPSLSRPTPGDERTRYTAIPAPSPGIPEAGMGIPLPPPAAPSAIGPSRAAGTATTFLVTSTKDTGEGSLRKAIEDANFNPGADIIGFQILPGGWQVISPLSPLPQITDPLTIDGTSAIGYFDQPRIQLDGSQAGAAYGLIVNALACEIKGISITRFQASGIALINHSASIEGCYIGLEADGVTAAGNGEFGIIVYSANNRIGLAGGRPNVVSGNGYSGIRIEEVNATGNLVVNTLVGTNNRADAAIANGGYGIFIQNASDILIGGTTPQARNVLAGNTYAGIGIRGIGARRITVQGNLIGLAPDTLLAIANRNHGVEIATITGETGTPSEILIGGALNSGARNVISGNTGVAVALYMDGTGGSGNVVAGNILGLDESETVAVPNTHGIYLQRRVDPALSSGVRIGGIRVDSANTIAGNTERGIWIDGAGAKNNIIRGNYVGVTLGSGVEFLRAPNRDFGIVLDGASMNEVGGADTLSGNVIGANAHGGIVLVGSGATGNTVINNYIGTAPGRPKNLGNGYNGIYFESAAGGNVIGRINAGNIIAYSQYAGIAVYSGEQNTLRGNIVYRNGSMGIDIAPGGFNANDTTDADTGPNTLTNFPLIDSVRTERTETIVHLRMNALPSTAYTVDIYSIDTLSATLFGEGQTYLATSTVTTGSNGWGTALVRLGFPVNTDLHLTATATDPLGNTSEFCRAVCLADADGDGLYDCWETQGIGMDIDMNGLMDLDLYGRGARPKHKDLFVEVDCMEGFVFEQPARDSARAVFARAPNSLVHNPDGKDGINLNLHYAALVDTLIPAKSWIGDYWAEYHAAKRRFFGSDAEREHPNAKMLLEAKKRVYRYCIFADRFHTSGYSGVAEGIPDNDFMVTLGTFKTPGGTREQQAGTFVHELGHTLGLRHGGGDDTPWKPNYVSLMNYMWQFPKPNLLDNRLTWKLVFSPLKLDDLNESNLNEWKGLGMPGNVPHPAAIFVYGDSTTGFRRGVLAPGAPVDWNNDRDSTSTGGVQRDLNGMGGTSPGELLTGFCDWTGLIYDVRKSENYLDPPPGLAKPAVMTADSVNEMTPAMLSMIESMPDYGLIPPQRAPRLIPHDTSTVGGNYGSLQIDCGTPAPAGGLKYYFRSLAPGLLSVDQSVQIPKDWTRVSVGFQTIGVEHDTTAYFYVDSLDVRIYGSIRIRPASLASLSARGDSGCVVTEPGGFRKRYLAGCTILLEASLNGQAPPLGGTIQLSSSRPDLIAPPASSPLGAFATRGLIPVHTASGISSPQVVILTASYRDSSRADTVILMPAPRYTFAQIGSGGSSGTSTLDLNNAGDVLINSYYVYRDGSLLYPSSFPGFTLHSITGMNDAGWLCGSVLDSTQSHQMPAYWKPDTTIALPVYGGAYPYGSTRGINARGDVIGFCEGKDWPYRQKPTLWRNDLPIELEEYGEFWLETIELNESDQIVGTGRYSMGYPNKRIAIRWDNTALTLIENPFNPMTYIDGVAMAENGTALIWSGPNYWTHRDSLSRVIPVPPPYYLLEPFAMNDSLQVVGRLLKSEGEGYTYSAFVFRDGYQYDLSCLGLFPAGWTNTTATGINNSGTIAGYGWYGGRMRYFLLTPSGPNDVTDPAPLVEIPTEFRLMQNYPNPFNPATMIRYTLPQVADVRLEVFTLLGQRVATLVDGRQAAGAYEVRLDGSMLSSGVYLYRLRAGAYVETRKMVLMK